MDSVTISLERYKELEAYEQTGKIESSIRELKEEKEALTLSIKKDLKHYKKNHIKVVYRAEGFGCIKYLTSEKIIQDMGECKVQEYKDDISRKQRLEKEEYMLKIATKMYLCTDKELRKFKKSASCEEWYTKLTGEK